MTKSHRNAIIEVILFMTNRTLKELEALSDEELINELFTTTVK